MNNKLLIDREKLKLLFESKKELLEKKVTLDSFLSAIAFLLSVAFGEYNICNQNFNRSIKFVLICIGVFFTIKAIKDLHDSKNRYTCEDLLKDINKINEVSSKHSIVCIRDTFHEYSNRYLVYYDERWDCLFFPNFKTVENNKDNIVERISRQLKLEPKYLDFEMITSEIQSKFSYSDKVNKFYDHTYYKGEILKFTDELMKDSFCIDGVNYYWKTISNLEKDKNTTLKNLDVVEVVKAKL